MKKSRTLNNIYTKYEYRFQPKSKHYLDKKKFVAIAVDICKEIYKYLTEGGSYKIPGYLGILQIIKVKTSKNRRKVDHAKTKVLGTVVYHTNRHSNGFHAKVIWRKSGKQSLFVGKAIYYFAFTRTNKRTLAKLIKDKNYINKYSLK